MSELKRTPLYQMHIDLGAKMVGFAGYDMPVQYPSGIMNEHTHTRAAAGLFDVSHMGQIIVKADSFEKSAQALEGIIPVNIIGLGIDRQRYGLLTNSEGGILDDLMLANRGDHIYVVLNAACKNTDIPHIRQHITNTDAAVEVHEITDRALLALQGPQAQAALSALNSAAADMRFMDVANLELLGAQCWVSRSGYTGEDGYEISAPAHIARALAEALLAQPDVAPIGLGARDSLRLEAGLCLYGHDIDTQTTPVEAGLNWAIQKVRRAGGARAGGFPGAEVILRQLQNGTDQRRVGLLPEGRAPMREGVELFADETAREPVGRITSGGFGPSIGAPVAMGYLPAALSAPGTRVFGALRGKRLPVHVAALPFTPANFKR